MQDEKIKFIIAGLKELFEGEEKIDMNKDKTEREMKIALLETSFNDLLSILKEGQEDKENINEMIDKIIDLLNDFRIQSTGKLEDILPRIYKKTQFVEDQETKKNNK